MLCTLEICVFIIAKIIIILYDDILYNIIIWVNRNVGNLQVKYKCSLKNGFDKNKTHVTQTSHYACNYVSLVPDDFFHVFLKFEDQRMRTYTNNMHTNSYTSTHAHMHSCTCSHTRTDMYLFTHNF